MGFGAIYLDGSCKNVAVVGGSSRERGAIVKGKPGHDEIRRNAGGMLLMEEGGFT